MKILTYNCSIHNPYLKKAGFDVFAVKRDKDFTNPMIIDTSRLFLLRTTEQFNDKIISLIKTLRDHWPLIDVLMVAPKCKPQFVLDAINAGCKDIILQDDISRIVTTVNFTINNQKILPRIPHASSRQSQSFRFEGMISRSIQMWDIFETIKQIADSDASVLILGETGTGKELVARAIHKHSRRKGRFVAINCSAVPENLIDSELFGHVKGAFTGADRDKKGLFRYAQDGSIFLDEIANMPLTAQHHLLRVLQENRIRPVGAHEEIDVNGRVIAATSQPLEEFVKNNKFREDLLYRLDVIRLELPPLRDRPEDIPFLFHFFAKKIAKSYQMKIPEFSERFLDALVRYDWPGNVRQLQNIAERLVLTLPGQKLMAKHLVKALKLRNREQEGSSEFLVFAKNQPLPDYQLAIKRAVERHEREYFTHLLQTTGGRIIEAADIAKISRRTLLRKMKKYEINKKSYNSTKKY